MKESVTWSPDGHSLVRFGINEIVSSVDPRAANGFVNVAVNQGWAEPLHANEDTPTKPRSTSMTARAAPATKSKRTVERIK